MKKHISILLLTASLLFSSCSVVSNSSSEPTTSKEETSSLTTSSSETSKPESSSIHQDSSESITSSNIEESSSEEVISSSEQATSSIDEGSSSSPESSSIEPVAHTHSWDEGTVTTPATCTTDGVRTYHCSGCNAIKQVTIDKTGHSLEHHDAKAATSTEAGNIEYWHCSNCNKDFSDQDGTTEATDVVIPATGVQYTITWKQDDGSTIDTSKVNKGAVPTHTNPTKAADSDYTYTFNAWNPTPVAASQDTSYTATYYKYEKRATGCFPNTLYFTNNKSWSNVYAYAWNGTGSNAGWPGVKMNFYKTNENSEKVYYLTGFSTYKNIIFNNGSSGGTNQTTNIGANDLPATDNAFYLLDTKDGEGKYKFGTWYEAGEQAAEISYDFATKGQNIIHCFDWKISTILANLDEIAAQGFTAIQTSPIQPVKDYEDSYNDTHQQWWRFYQPVGLCIGNSTTNILFDTDNGAAELSELTEEAAKRGLRVITDVIVNHLADDSTDEYTVSQNLSPQVAQFNPEIYNNKNSTLHNPSSAYIKDYSSAYGITHSDCFGKDLNTANSTVQSSVLTFLKSLIDCGVTGFRFDAAKHIETSLDAEGVKSNFWANTLGAACTYASTTYGRTIWSYGETLTANEHGRWFGMYIDSWFYAVTPPDDYYNVGLGASNCVFWGESHDTYMSGKTANADTGQDSVNETYKSKGKWNSDINMLYFVRPDVTAKISAGGVGYHADWGWQNGQVKIGNAR